MMGRGVRTTAQGRGLQPSAARHLPASSSPCPPLCALPLAEDVFSAIRGRRGHGCLCRRGLWAQPSGSLLRGIPALHTLWLGSPACGTPHCVPFPACRAPLHASSCMLVPACHPLHAVTHVLCPLSVAPPAAPCMSPLHASLLWMWCPRGIHTLPAASHLHIRVPLPGNDL